MLALHNETPWSAGLFPGWNRQREFQFTAVFKAGFAFELDGTVTPLDETPAIIEADAHRGEALTSSLKEANEIAPFKEGSEIYLHGTAHPDGPGRRITEVGLGIAFPNGKGFKKVLRVFGRREWQRNMVSHAPSQPEVLEPTPIIYEYAFGGVNPNDPDDRYPQNPAGLGLNGKGWELSNRELPRIEQGPNFISSPAQKPAPAGFGPLPVFWQPRADENGDMSETEDGQGECPWSEDAEPVLHNVAPPDQRFAWPLTGGEVVHLAGFFPGRSLKQVVRFAVPQLVPQLYTVIDGERAPLEPVCDTLVIDTDRREFYLVWRVGIAWRLLDPRQGWVVLEDQHRDATDMDGQGEGAVPDAAATGVRA